MSEGSPPPVIVIQSLAHAVAALSAAADSGRPITLLSAPEAGLSAGSGWWSELIAAARGAVPSAECSAFLDCSDDAGAAQAAIRAGVEGIIFTGRADIAERLADIAGQRGSRVLTERPAATLDLADEFFANLDKLRQLVADVLASHAGFC